MTQKRAWDEGLGTGVDSMDAEHRLQVSLINAVEELVRQGRDAELLGKTLQQLVDFTSVHFLSEELMMRLHAYPQHDAHKAAHGELMDQLDVLKSKVAAGEQRVALELIEGLRAWLVAHVKSMDQGFALWCAKNDILAK
jgi:hemerythrin